MNAADPMAAIRRYIDAFNRGEPVTQSGAIFTVALRNLAEGWRIAAWAWTKGTR